MLSARMSVFLSLIVVYYLSGGARGTLSHVSMGHKRVGRFDVSKSRTYGHALLWMDMLRDLLQ